MYIISDISRVPISHNEFGSFDPLIYNFIIRKLNSS